MVTYLSLPVQIAFGSWANTYVNATVPIIISYSNDQTVGGYAYPLSIAISVNGTPLITATIQNIKFKPASPIQISQHNRRELPNEKNSLDRIGTHIFMPPCFAQTPGTGFPKYGSFDSSPADTVNRYNLNSVLTMPMVSGNGRGLGFSIITLVQFARLDYCPSADRTGLAAELYEWRWTIAVGMEHYSACRGDDLHSNDLKLWWPT